MTTQNSDIRRMALRFAAVVLAAVAAGIFVGALIARCTRRIVVQEKVVHTTDTVVVRKTDSIFVDKVHQLPGRIDTMFVFNGTDTLYLEGYAYDTIYIDSMVMKLVTRDTIIHDTTIIERTVDKKIRHCGVGVSAGISAIYGIRSRKFDVGPGVTVGFIYKF